MSHGVEQSERASGAVLAIVPAAGRSRRMGRAKQWLEVGGRPLLLGVVESLRQAGVTAVAIVTHAEVATRLSRDEPIASEVFIVRNDDADSEMIDSVRLGLRAWRERRVVGERDGFLICPADHPALAVEDIANCIDRWRSEPDRIVIATRDGRRGHPIIFSATWAAFVESPACDGGLNALPRTKAESVCEVECRSPGVTQDIDTPEDYDRFR